MSASLIIYFAEVCEGFKAIFAWSAGLAAVIIVLTIPFWAVEDEGRKWVFRLGPLFIFTTACIAAVIPSKDTAYMMAAAKVGQEIVTSQPAKEIGDKLLKVINQKLDEQIKK